MLKVACHRDQKNVYIRVYIIIYATFCLVCVVIQAVHDVVRVAIHDTGRLGCNLFWCEHLYGTVAISLCRIVKRDKVRLFCDHREVTSQKLSIGRRGNYSVTL